MFRNKMPKFGVGRRNSEKDNSSDNGGPTPMDTDVTTNSSNTNNGRFRNNSQQSSSGNSSGGGGMPKQRSGPSFKDPSALDDSARSSSSIGSFGRKAASTIMKKKSGKIYISRERTVYLMIFLNQPPYFISC